MNKERRVNKMVEYNERKRQVLAFVRDNPSVTSSELARTLNLEIHNARTLLKKYFDQGLLSRRKNDCFGTRNYEATEKGLKRLKWLSGEQTSSVAEEPLNVGELEKEVAPAPIMSEEISLGERVRAAQVERLRKFIELFKNIPDSK